MKNKVMIIYWLTIGPIWLVAATLFVAVAIIINPQLVKMWLKGEKITSLSPDVKTIQ